MIFIHKFVGIPNNIMQVTKPMIDSVRNWETLHNEWETIMWTDFLSLQWQDIILSKWLWANLYKFSIAKAIFPPKSFFQQKKYLEMR